MKRRRFQALSSGLASAVILLAPASCYARSIECPQTVVVKQELPEAATPWETFQEQVPSRLMSVAVFEGHPKERATLVPDAEATKGGKQVYTWRLPANTAHPYWLACGYDRTSVILVRPLDPGVSSCQVTYDPQITVGGLPSVVGIVCK
jgi:hypothetical protein